MFNSKVFRFVQKQSVRQLQLFLFFLFACIISVQAEYYKYVPIEVTQPDKTVIKCFTSGDEYFHWLHDKAGYTIIQSDSDGYYYYAVKNGDILAPSKYKVGSVDPASVGLSPWTKISGTKYEEYKIQRTSSRLKSTSSLSTGVLTNIVIYVRFKGEAEFTKTRQEYDNLFNSTTLSSLKGYYNEVSYGKLSMVSSQYPTCDVTTNLSYEDINERGYYSPYNSVTNPIGYNGDNGSREQALVQRAIDAVKSQIPSNLVIDTNNDGLVDNVTIVVHGNADGWGKLLWPHQWWLYMNNTYINSKQVGTYIFITENMLDVSTMCHEMFHVIGAPDLYHYTDNGIDPTGSWSGGITHMLAYMKWKYSGKSWISNIPEITASGTYYLKALTSSKKNCYKIKSPNSSSEYYVLEFRNKVGLYEGNIPSSGLIITRINTLANGNGDGPPDEVYVCRTGGTPFANGDVSNAQFNIFHSSFSSTTNPRPFLSDGSDAGIKITNIAITGDSLKFTATIGAQNNIKTAWTVTTDSYENGTAYSPGIYTIDDDASTIWHTPWSNTTVYYPHWIQVNFGKFLNIKGFNYLPRQDMDNGRIKDFEFFISADGVNWTSVTKGTFPNSKLPQIVTFPEQYCKYVKLLAKNEVNGKAFASIAELNFIFGTTCLPKTNWTLLNATSFETSYDPYLAYDNKAGTFWSSKTTAPAATFPHELAIDMKDTFCLEAASYLPRQDASTAGTISRYQFYTSMDGINWTLVSQGYFSNNKLDKMFSFPKTVCRYIKMVSLAEVSGGTSATIAEISAFGVKSNDILKPAKPVNFRISSRSGKSLSLAWDKDASDKSILNYKIITPDSLVGTVFNNALTTNIDTSRNYIFSISAIDGSGNVSDTACVNFAGITTASNIATAELPVIYESNNVICITKMKGENNIQVFDLLGKPLYNVNCNLPQTYISTGRYKGIAIVVIEKNGNIIVRKKVMIK